MPRKKALQFAIPFLSFVRLLAREDGRSLVRNSPGCSEGMASGHRVPLSLVEVLAPAKAAFPSLCPSLATEGEHSYMPVSPSLSRPWMDVYATASFMIMNYGGGGGMQKKNRMRRLISFLFLFCCNASLLGHVRESVRVRVHLCAYT